MRMFFLDSSNSSLTGSDDACCKQKKPVRVSLLNPSIPDDNLPDGMGNIDIPVNGSPDGSNCQAPEYRSELVHDTAVYTAVVVFSSLTYFSQFKFVDFTFTEQFIQCESICTFRAAEEDIPAPRGTSPEKAVLNPFTSTPRLIISRHTPKMYLAQICTGSILFVQTKFYIIFQVDRIKHLLCQCRSV